MKKTSWKTTVGGVAGSLGTILGATAHDDVMKGIAAIVGGIGILLLGLAARDNNVTSEQAGAKP
jgi:sulfite exporter TauE/SafE